MARMPPGKTEAGAIAWQASRKQTLSGQLGTGNTISMVVQYPNSTRDPGNACSGLKRHLSAEDRRILRVRVKARMKKRPNYPASVLIVEEHLIQGFRRSPELCHNFFCNEAFAEEVLIKAARAAEGYSNPSGKESLWAATYFGEVGAAPSFKPGLPAGSSSVLRDEKGKIARDSAGFTVPGHHHVNCGPVCCCLKFSDAPLSFKTDVDGVWSSSFMEKSRAAAGSVAASVGTATAPAVLACQPCS